MRFVRAETREAVVSEVADELRLSGVTNDIADQVVADYLGLNRTDMRCLDIIERLDKVSAGRLAAEAGLSTGAVTTVLDRLDRAGLARRGAGPGGPAAGPGRRSPGAGPGPPAARARRAHACGSRGADRALRAARRRHAAAAPGVHDRGG